MGRDSEGQAKAWMFAEIFAHTVIVRRPAATRYFAERGSLVGVNRRRLSLRRVVGADHPTIDRACLASGVGSPIAAVVEVAPQPTRRREECAYTGPATAKEQRKEHGDEDEFEHQRESSRRRAVARTSLARSRA